MTEIFNTSFQTDRRRLLRESSTKAEKLLWAKLKNAQLLGFKFRRQYGVGPYIVDFYCVVARLVIELDGSIHTEIEQRAKDIERQKEIEVLGLTVLRFTNLEIETNIDSALANISLYLLDSDRTLS